MEVRVHPGKHGESSGVDKARKLVAEIEGWLTDREVDFLHQTARDCAGDGVILEIRSYKGKSTVCLAKGSQAGSHVHVYAVDPHIGTFQQSRGG